MKWIFLRNGARCAQATFATFVYLTAASVALATQTCTWFDEWDGSTDPSNQERLEAHVKTLAGLKNPVIKQLQKHYFLIGAEGTFCKEVPRCEYRILELRDGVVKNVFAFEGTGMIWRLWTPSSYWVENLGDDYSAWAFETSEHTYIRVDLPRSRDLVAISSPGSMEMQNLLGCSGIKR